MVINVSSYLPLAGQRRVGYAGAWHSLQQQLWRSRTILLLRSGAAAEKKTMSSMNQKEIATNLCEGFGFGGGDWAMMLCSLFGEIPISLQTPLTQIQMSTNSKLKKEKIRTGSRLIYLDSLGMMSGLGGDISNSSCPGFLILS